MFTELLDYNFLSYLLPDDFCNFSTCTSTLGGTVCVTLAEILECLNITDGLNDY
jgi:hypothetical protein